jgi:uncharacterized membrane protein
MKEESNINYLVKRLVNYFLQGLLYVLPLGLTIFVIIYLVNQVDGILAPIFTHFLNIKIPGLGLLSMLIIITIFGYIGQSVLGRPFKLVIERLLQKAPLLNMVYTSIRDFMEAFVGKEKKFNQPVLIKVSSTSEMQRMGFITQNDLSELSIKDKVAVYIPFAYAFSGELYIVPASYVTSVNVSSGEWMKFIISGGITKV